MSDVQFVGLSDKKLIDLLYTHEESLRAFTASEDEDSVVGWRFAEAIVGVRAELARRRVELAADVPEETPWTMANRIARQVAAGEGRATKEELAANPGLRIVYGLDVIP